MIETNCTLHIWCVLSAGSKAASLSIACPALLSLERGHKQPPPLPLSFSLIFNSLWFYLLPYNSDSKSSVITGILLMVIFNNFSQFSLFVYSCSALPLPSVIHGFSAWKLLATLWTPGSNTTYYIHMAFPHTHLESLVLLLWPLGLCSHEY